jgi:transcriptional regulator with XRE-family HTH domain
MGAIGARIRAARLAAGLSQETAAERSGVGYKRWQEIEGGAANPTIRTLDRIATTLGVEIWNIVRKGGRPRARR